MMMMMMMMAMKMTMSAGFVVDFHSPIIVVDD
jgi:hypothetical protein